MCHRLPEGWYTEHSHDILAMSVMLCELLDCEFLHEAERSNTMLRVTLVSSKLNIMLKMIVSQQLGMPSGRPSCRVCNTRTQHDTGERMDMPCSLKASGDSRHHVDDGFELTPNLTLKPVLSYCCATPFEKAKMLTRSL